MRDIFSTQLIFYNLLKKKANLQNNTMYVLIFFFFCKELSVSRVFGTAGHRQHFVRSDLHFDFIIVNANNVVLLQCVI